LAGNIPAPAQTTDSKGIGVVQVQGSVSLDGTTAATGATIFPGDSIQTGPDGSVLVNMPGRGSLVIAANSSIIFPPVTQGSHLVALQRGKFALHILSEAAGTTAEFGKFVLRPIIGQGAEYDVEIAPDGSALVRCFTGTIGIIEAQGANSTFLNAGQSAQISATGSVERIGAAGAPPPNSTPPPSSTSPSGKSKSYVGWIILAAAAGGVAAVVAVVVSEHKPATVSPSSP
jgi:hypothetical protein